jgi:hypothetical protein
MEDKKNNENISFRIMRVKDIAFSANENLFNPEKKREDIKISVNCEFRSNIEFDLIIIEIFSFYYYDPKIEVQLASVTVQTAFNVVNLKKFSIDNRLKLPPNFLVTLISISLSHTRALFSKNIDGTSFTGMTMPLIHPEEFAKSIFPEIFNGTGLVHQSETIEEINNKVEAIIEKPKIKKPKIKKSIR